MPPAAIRSMNFGDANASSSVHSSWSPSSGGEQTLAAADDDDDGVVAWSSTSPPPELPSVDSEVAPDVGVDDIASALHEQLSSTTTAAAAAWALPVAVGLVAMWLV